MKCIHLFGANCSFPGQASAATRLQHGRLKQAAAVESDGTRQCLRMCLSGSGSGVESKSELLCNDYIKHLERCTALRCRSAIRTRAHKKHQAFVPSCGYFWRHYEPGGDYVRNIFSCRVVPAIRQTLTPPFLPPYFHSFFFQAFFFFSTATVQRLQSTATAKPYAVI